MSQRNKVEVRIAGKDYRLVGVDSDEHIQKIGLYVDKKMNEVLRANVKLSTSMAAVLTALNIADDYSKIKDSEEALRKELEDLRRKFKELSSQTESLIVERERNAKQRSDLQIELAKREAELHEVRNSITKANR